MKRSSLAAGGTGVVLMAVWLALRVGYFTNPVLPVPIDPNLVWTRSHHWDNTAPPSSSQRASSSTVSEKRSVTSAEPPAAVTERRRRRRRQQTTPPPQSKPTTTNNPMVRRIVNFSLGVPPRYFPDTPNQPTPRQREGHRRECRYRAADLRHVLVDQQHPQVATMVSSIESFLGAADPPDL